MNIGIVGGGIAGLFTAWTLAKQGQAVALFEQAVCGGGATRHAAGMLAPVNELEFQELELLRAGIASRDLYFDLEKELGDIALDRSGTLEVALTQDDTEYLRRLYDFQRQHSLPVEWLTGAEAREKEPFLSRNVPFAIWSPRDVQVGHPLLVGALLRECAQAGVTLHEHEAVRGWEKDESGKIRVRTEKRETSFDKLVVAAGAAEFPDAGLPFRVYPVRGEMVALRVPDYEFLTRTVRIRNKVLGAAYMVPKRCMILCGSTSEEKGLRKTNTAGGLLDILRKCYAAVPGIYELEVLETWAGFRPATLSRQPVVDREADREVYHLNGLYRHGILLAPLLAKGIAQLMLTGRRMPEIEGFRIRD